jgi:hypothetical protein
MSCDKRDDSGYLTHLTTPVGGELTEEELRAIEHHWGMDPNSLVKGIRTGKQDVSVTQRPEAIHEIKLIMTV